MKKVFSLVLCVAILYCAAIPAFAGHESCDCGFSPIIYVGPLGCTPIVRDAGTPDEQTLWRADTKFLISKDGETIKRFSPTAEPKDMEKDIEEML